MWPPAALWSLGHAWPSEIEEPTSHASSCCVGRLPALCGRAASCSPLFASCSAVALLHRTCILSTSMRWTHTLLACEQMLRLQAGACTSMQPPWRQAWRAAHLHALLCRHRTLPAQETIQLTSHHHSRALFCQEHPNLPPRFAGLCGKHDMSVRNAWRHGGKA